MPQIIPTAEPFFFPGKPGQPGCLLIHGFTGAPKEMRLLGEHLHALGMHCLGIRLSGHATAPEDMIRSRYGDWIASVEDGYHLLRGSADRIYLLGLSMGGVLALLMSTRLPVQGVVSMSAPYSLPVDLPCWMMHAINLVLRYQPLGKGDPAAGWFDHEAYTQHVSYPQNPVRSGIELKKLLREMRAALPAVAVPTLLMHSRNDTYVPPVNMENLFADLGARDKTKCYVTQAGHVITRDTARQEVFETAGAFLLRIEAGR